MKNNEVEELKHKLEIQRDIFYTCGDIFNDIKYLQGHDTKSEVEQDLLGFEQWSFISELLWNYLVLQLNKLYSESSNDQYRIKAVLNVLINQFNRLPFKDKIDKSDISILLAEFNGPIFKENYRKINNIRDKYVAHIDRDRASLRIQNQDIEYFI